ncbi:hypothetical protein O6H91_20G033700 [Diphasiastrum complanatum]|uniref:Uncharacterized protein n=1 Tax=Diphasiastrum complanatum TaxID=34168 RepID=A0ACC2AP02_DIPCM|nr:hypothetical protein O6H91_20G033700 [Diphasiastrum complanatum]
MGHWMCTRPVLLVRILVKGDGCGHSSWKSPGSKVETPICTRVWFSNLLSMKT